MSKYDGSQIVPVRFPAQELQQMDEYITASQYTREADPWSRSTFIRKAVRDKLAHLKRSRGGKPLRKQSDAGSVVCGDTPRADDGPAPVQAPAG